MRKFLVVLVLMSLMIVGLASVSAQDDGMGSVPMVAVVDQLSLDGTVTIDSVYSEGPGFVVIHIDNNGAPGPVAGNAWIPAGHSHNVAIDIDTTMATPTLYAMLHTDTGEVGVYEFGTVDGADGPVAVDGNVVTPSFGVAVVDGQDQFVVDNTVTLNSIVTPTSGWVVVHAGDAETFGDVLGFAWLDAGLNTAVTVELDGELTNVLWAMIHIDTGEAEVYEFGTVEGADGPVIFNGAVATAPFWTVPHVVADDQVVLHADNYEGMMMDDMAPTFHAHSVLSEGLGWLVIHSDNNGAPGPVLGQAQVEAGYNAEVNVALDGDITPVVWPMLHVDTGESGAYEFGTVDGADGPVMVDGNVLVFPVSVAPMLSFPADGGVLDGNMLHAGDVVIDATGWLVIHSDNDGAPGPVLGQARLMPGLNTNVWVEVDADGVGSQVWPMLHYDTGESGVYEFGAVEGADGPVIFGGDVLVAPLSIQ